MGRLSSRRCSNWSPGAIRRVWHHFSILQNCFLDKDYQGGPGVREFQPAELEDRTLIINLGGRGFRTRLANLRHLPRFGLYG